MVIQLVIIRNINDATLDPLVSCFERSSNSTELMANIEEAYRNGHLELTDILSQTSIKFNDFNVPEYIQQEIDRQVKEDQNNAAYSCSYHESYF